MTRFSIFAGLLVLSVPTLAIGKSFDEIDANADGVLTLDELQTQFPDVTSDSFFAMDLNADGRLDADEARSAQEAGLLATTDG